MECKGWIELEALIDFDPESLTLNGVYITLGEAEIDVLPYLDDDGKKAAQGWASDHLDELAQEAQDRRDEYADYLYEQAKDRKLGL